MPKLAGGLLGITLWLVLGGAAGAGLTQSQQSCATGLNKRFAIASKAVGKEFGRCTADVQKGKYAGSVAECIADDRVRRIGKARGRTNQVDSNLCEGTDKQGLPRRPALFANDPDTLNQIASDRGAVALDALFGPDGGRTLSEGGQLFSEPDDKRTARCQLSVTKSVVKCEAARLSGFKRCRKDALKEGAQPFPDGATTAAELSTCVLDDPLGKIAAACDLGSHGDARVDKRRAVLEKQCTRKGVDLCEAFPQCCPPCAAGDVDCVHACLDTPVGCEACRSLNAADGLVADCDLRCLAHVEDPGAGPWPVVPPERVADECGLDPDALGEIDATFNQSWAVFRYGKLCHEYHLDGVEEDPPSEAFSTTKTLGAFVTGVAAYETRDLPRTGRKTGPLRDDDRVDHWLDSFTFNPDAQVAHVLGMVAHNADLGFEQKLMQYDGAGNIQINRLSDVVNEAISQDPARLGNDLEEFFQTHVVAPLGFENSTWTNSAPTKIYGFTWNTTLQDMGRLGVAINHFGVWDGRRLLDPEWAYRMTHPSFEDGNTGYGYLTWLAAKSNFHFGGILGYLLFQAPIDPCSPAAINAEFPHGISAAPDCYYSLSWSCEQTYDVGVWAALGAGGQLIVGHRGLDLVLVGKNLGGAAGSATLWDRLRPALVALDPTFAGDVGAFCGAYAFGDYAPDLPVAP